MAEISKQSAKRQFAKFANAYKKLRGINLVWHAFDERNKEAWDFAGKDTKTNSVLYVQYTEGIVNQKQKANIEAHKRGEYEFTYAHGIRHFKKVVEEAYGKKVKMADKNLALLIGFHDFGYDVNNKHDDIESISPHMKKKYGDCAYKEVWIINQENNSCNLVFE